MIKYVNLRKQLLKTWENWHVWSQDQKQEFVEKRKEEVGKNTDRTGEEVCKSSGTSSCSPKIYLWGPNCDIHRKFYESIFYDFQEHIWVILSEGRESKTYFKHSNVMQIVFGGGSFNVDKIKNKHIVCNPEATAFYLRKYGDFIDTFFDKNSCTFTLTCSALKKSHLDLLKEHGIEKVKDCMRCWDGGATFFTCPYGSKHWISMASEITVENNKLISTDLWNSSQKFLSYHNGDLINWNKCGKCSCGLEIDEIEFLENPRFFEINGIPVHYDPMLNSFKRYAEIDYFFIDVHKDKMILNFRGVPQTGFNDYLKEIKNVFEQKGVALEAEFLEFMPEYERKYKRIQIHKEKT